jgi:hypothetical protein
MGRPKTNKLSLMSDNDLMLYLKARYQKLGVEGLTYTSLKKEKGLYSLLYSRGLRAGNILSKLGLENELKKHKENKLWGKIIDIVDPIVEEKGFLPPAQWFQSNGFSSLVYYVYSLNKNWEVLRDHYNSFEDSSFITSRNGMRWRSRPEASLSNFLYARGIEQKPGEKYPEEYASYGDASYGYYDLHFISSSDEWVDVEVWGDKPNGHNESGYATKREAKEEFNKSNSSFLGMNFRDCYDDIHLESLLKPYIGLIDPFVFDKPEDKIIQTTHWSDADELIEYCIEIAKSQPDGKFPTEEWLRKRGKWRNRDGPVYNTVSIYTKTWIGGIRKLRRIMGQSENSTVKWCKKSAIKEYKSWFEGYGFTASQATTGARNLSKEEKNKAQNISQAVAKYVGPIEKINSLLNIDPVKLRKWSEAKILEKFLMIYEKYQLTPSQMVRLSQEDKSVFNVADEDIVVAKQIIDRLGSYFSGVKEVYGKLKIKPIDIRILRKQHLVSSLNCDKSN